MSATEHPPTQKSEPPLQKLRRVPLLGKVADWGLGPSAASKQTREAGARIAGLKATESVCPYCAVGCGQIVYTRDGELVDIEGNPRSPINQGTLCPKGAASRQLIMQPNRLTKVKYRAPYSDHWEERPLEWAMARIAQLVKQTRDETFVRELPDGTTVNHTLALAELGGATLDNEENYLIKKLCAGGLGMAWVENQARV